MQTATAQPLTWPQLARLEVARFRRVSDGKKNAEPGVEHVLALMSDGRWRTRSEICGHVVRTMPFKRDVAEIAVNELVKGGFFERGRVSYENTLTLRLAK